MSKSSEVFVLPSLTFLADHRPAKLVEIPSHLIISRSSRDRLTLTINRNWNTKSDLGSCHGLRGNRDRTFYQAGSFSHTDKAKTLPTQSRRDIKTRPTIVNSELDLVRNRAQAHLEMLRAAMFDRIVQRFL